MSPGGGGDNSGTEIERWWLVFCDRPYPAWWKVFCRKGFSHCFAFRQPKSGILIFLDPLVHRVENAIVLERASDVIARAKAENMTVLVYTKRTLRYDPHTDVRVGRGWFLTCASYLAYTLGIPFSWRSTPWQLYKAALKAGAEEL